MSKSKPEKLFDTSHAVSLLCVMMLVVVMALGASSLWMTLLAMLFLAISVMMSVHHAEVIAVKVGPSLGALILALCVTVIEVGLIVSLMTNDTPDSATVAQIRCFLPLLLSQMASWGFVFLLVDCGTLTWGFM